MKSYCRIPAFWRWPRGRGAGRSRGLSVIELMVSLAITAMLLTAIAAAYLSSAQVIENNDRFFRATQAGRVALAQILTEIRRCDSIPLTVSAASPYRITGHTLPIMRPEDAPRQPNEDLRIYQYEPDTKRIVLFFRYENGTESPRYPIASNIQVSPFTWDEGRDAANRACVAYVSVDVEVAVGKQTIRLSGSAAPRRSMTFK